MTVVVRRPVLAGNGPAHCGATTRGFEMQHNSQPATTPNSNGSKRMKFHLSRGTECWFDVDDITIHIWASNWTGREIVSIRNGGSEQVVSDVRSFRFITPHEFERNGHRYRLEFRLSFGKIEVHLYRDGELIDSDLFDNTGIRINPETGRLDWGHAMRRMALPMLGGAAFGSAIGYLLAGLLT